MEHKSLKRLICLATILLLGGSSGLYSQELFLSKVELEKDLSVFIDIYEHHPGKFLYRTKSEIDSVKKELSLNLKDSISYDEFYLDLLQALVFLKDGHTGLSLGNRYSVTKRSKTTLPFRYKILDGKVYIIDTLSAGLNNLMYSKIISVNEIPIDSILSIFFKYTTADNNNTIYRKRYNERIFGQNIDFFYGVRDKYKIECVSLDGDTITQSVSGIKDYDLKNKSKEPQPLNSYFDHENNLAILTVNTFNYRKIVLSGFDFHDFIDGFFKQVKKEKIKNVAIDIRENYGGSGALAMCLYAYICPQDFKWMDYSYTYFDGSENFAQFSQYKDGQYPFLKNHDTLQRDDRIKLTNGLDSKATMSSTKIPFGPKMKIKDISKNKFYGDVYILTSGITFSAGSIFASKCRERENTIIVGEPTGSASGVFCGGGILTIRLPNSGFKVELPTMERHISISQNFNPVQPVNPDYLVIKNIDDIKQGDDLELRKIHELINK